MTRIEVRPDAVTVEAKPGETVLDALSRSGYGYRTGCTRGGCGICKVDLVHGTVEYNACVADSVLSADEITDGTCLSCRAVPVGDILIALRDERLRRLNPFVTCRTDASTTSDCARQSGRNSAPRRFGTPSPEQYATEPRLEN